MPLKNSIRYPLPLTPAQKARLLEIAPDGNAAQYIRDLIKEDCAKRGIEWPDDLVQRGKYNRKGN